MKKIYGFLVICLISLLTMSAWAAGPYMVCDPQTGVTHYKLTGPSWLPTNTTWAQGWEQGGKLYFTDPGGTRTPVHVITDVSAALVGVTNTTVSACKSDPVWGESCSSTTPFAFERPGAANIPIGIKLIAGQ